MKSLGCSQEEFGTLVQEAVSYLQQQQVHDLRSARNGHGEFIERLISNHTEVFDRVPTQLSWYDDRGRAFLRYAKQKIAKSTCERNKWAHRCRSQTTFGQPKVIAQQQLPLKQPILEHDYTLQVTRGLPYEYKDVHSYTTKGLVEASTGKSDPPVSEIVISDITLIALKGWLQQDKIMPSENDELWGMNFCEGQCQRISTDSQLREFLRSSLLLGVPKGLMFVKAAEESSSAPLLPSYYLLTSHRCPFPYP